MKSLLVFAVLVAMVTAMAVSPEVETVGTSYVVSLCDLLHCNQCCDAK